MARKAREKVRVKTGDDFSNYLVGVSSPTMARALFAPIALLQSLPIHCSAMARARDEAIRMILGVDRSLATIAVRQNIVASV